MQQVTTWGPANGNTLQAFIQTLIDGGFHIDFIIPMNYTVNMPSGGSMMFGGGCTVATVLYSTPTP